MTCSLERLGAFYDQRGHSGDAERAFGCLDESLEVARRLYEANPESAQAARDVSLSLIDLGGFYLERGQSGDAERTLGFSEEGLQIARRLHEANPESAQTARDVSRSLERLGAFYVQRGHSGDASRALGYFEESLGIWRRLHEANPDVKEARALVGACWQTAVLASKLGDKKMASSRRAKCWNLLQGLRQQGAPFDEFMQRVYEALSSARAEGDS